MDDTFNDLEKAVLQWFADHHKELPIEVQIANCKLVRREYTVKGFFVYFKVPAGAAPIEKISWPLDGSHIESLEVEYGACTLLWGKDGYADCLEMAAYGSTFGEHVKDFELKTF